MGSAMDNVLTNGQARPITVVQGGVHATPTLLGRAAPRIPVAGRIRAGIKVLTRRAAENERARAIYERGASQGKSFDTIEREIADAVPDLKNPLTPKNVPYFTVRGEDFPNPEIARRVPLSIGTGACVMQYRVWPSSAYSDQKRRSLAVQATSSCGITDCQASAGNTTGSRYSRLTPSPRSSANRSTICRAISGLGKSSPRTVK